MFNEINASQLSQALGKDRTTVYRWIKEGLPRNRNKSFSLPRVIDWLLDRQRRELMDGVDGPASPALERWRESRAQLAALELQERQGRLISLDEVGECWAQRYGVLKGALLNLKHRLPPLLEGKLREDMMEVLKREVIQILTRLHKRGQWTPWCDDEMTEKE